MEDLLKNIIEIDSEAKGIIKTVENKDEKIDQIIEDLLNTEKQKIDNKYKFLLDNKKKELEDRYNKIMAEIAKEERETFYEFEKKYETQKYELEEKILKNILSGGVEN